MHTCMQAQHRQWHASSRRLGVHVTGIAFVVYALIGFFGAADFGSNTQGNILENDLGGGAGQGVVNSAMSCKCDADATCNILASYS